MEYVYDKAANGMTVRIPADKYPQWKLQQEKLKAGEDTVRILCQDYADAYGGLEFSEAFKIDIKKAPKGTNSRVYRYDKGTALSTVGASADSVTDISEKSNGGFSALGKGKTSKSFFLNGDKCRR